MCDTKIDIIFSMKENKTKNDTASEIIEGGKYVEKAISITTQARSGFIGIIPLYQFYAWEKCERIDDRLLSIVVNR